MIKSIVSRAVAIAGSAIPRVGTRLVHNGRGGVVGTSSLLKPINFRPLGALMKVHDTKAKGDDELITFLTEEISTEKKNQREGPLPTTLDGFEIQLNQSEITLVKKWNNELLTINLNVNHTVDADYSEETEPKAGQAEKDAEMRSRPNFEIDIKKGNKTLSFSCSYLQDVAAAESQQDEYQDAFVIEEISIFDGEGNEDVYAVAGDILDGYLYDLFMNMLEERGVTNEFVDKLSDFATDYEHKLYINLLSQLQTFLSSK